MKKTVKILCIVLSAIVLAVSIYLIYVVLSYHRLEDNLSLETFGGATNNAPVNTELSLLI